MNTMDFIYDAHIRSLNTINLIASEAWFSPEYKLPYILDLYHRYSFDLDKISNGKGLPVFSSMPPLNAIETRCIELLKYHFNCAYASVKPVSGLNMMISVLSSVTRQGDRILSIPIEAGGHSATRHIAQRIGLFHDFMPIENKEGFDIQIDYLKLRQMINEEKIRCIYIDLMNVLNPIDLSNLRSEVGSKCVIIYDASHVLGLILGGKFQNPLQEGADILVGTTHKTFPGPHKGVVLTNSRWFINLYKMNANFFISHHHIADVAAMALILEQPKHSFCDYAERVITNCKVFIEECKKHGIKAMGGSSHQVWIEVNPISDISSRVRNLNNVGVLVNEISLPFSGNSGLRIGLQEVTYRGMEEVEIRQLATIICSLLNGESLSQNQEKCLEYLKKGLNESFINGLSIFKEYIDSLRLIGVEKNED